MSGYTHWFAPITMFRVYVTPCRVIRRRGGIIGALFGKVLIETEDGYTGWQAPGDVIAMKEAAA